MMIDRQPENLLSYKLKYICNKYQPRNVFSNWLSCILSNLQQLIMIYWEGVKEKNNTVDGQVKIVQN